MGILLIFISCLQAKELHIALLDTPSCPNLISKHKNVIINPLVDLTQSHDYKCYQGALNKRLFHGHWVLENILKNIEPNLKIRFTPLVVFDQKGNQKLDYWKRAFEHIKNQKVDMIISAAGFPLIDENLKKEATQIEIPQIPLFLAIGRKSPFLRKEVALFPHIHSTWQTLTFGSYHKAFDKKDQAKYDLNQFSKPKPKYLFPFEDLSSAYPKLKGSSLSVALGLNFTLKNCLNSLNQTNAKLLSKSLQECLNKYEKSITFGNSPLKGLILTQ